ncbi:hypothetical protein [Catenuloplanes indicus]|uniref:Uncharacterized protein n=1 Tax=Catenuloplanes indicus TaxID=137267 RepID=A0AAE3VZ63_9ACTN|nr:hypothetical protein [Catenuloplanes indicus]MDQ0366913.1 hypothetical protein [Catenuloplanes indicus]
MNATTPEHTSGDGPTTTPRFITHDQMRDIESNTAEPLPSLRERGFVRHDGSWWVRDRDGYHEITSSAQNTKLDRWHVRLTEGALWT